ncbi:UNVERIFIED_CONTAM: hypothetical protein FKN15_039996 [Acipenser sinensis]
MTVGAAYEKVKMGIVCFYLASLDSGAVETVVQVEDKVPEVTVCCEKSGLAQFCVPPKVSLHSESESDTAAHLLKNFPSSPLKETSEFDCCTLTEGELGHGASRNILQSSAFLSAMHSSDSEIEFGPLNYDIETCDDTLPWEVHFISNLNQQVVSSNKPMPQGAITFVSSISEKSAAMLPSCSTQTPKGDITILPSLLFPLPAPDCSTVQLPPQHNLAPSSSPLQQVLQLPPPMPGSLTLQLSPDHSLSPSSPPIQQLANSPQPAQLSPTQQNADVRILTLRRVIILQDMLGEFKDSNILNASLTIEFVDEAGSDVSGISRDAYSAFWEAFFQNCAEGEYERVPALYPEYGKEEWEAVGRILLKGYLDQSYFPIQLSLAFAVGLVYGESEITPGILMASFLRYIAPFEKDIITSTLDGSIGADDQDELLDILSRMGCHTVPSHDSMKGTILQVAHKQLIQEPKYALEVMADVTRSTLQKLLPEVSNLEALYEAKKPTVKQPAEGAVVRGLNTGNSKQDHGVTNTVPPLPLSRSERVSDLHSVVPIHWGGQSSPVYLHMSPRELTSLWQHLATAVPQSGMTYRVHEGDKMGLVQFPSVGSTIPALAQPANLVLLSKDAACPNKQCRVTEVLLKKAYSTDSFVAQLGNYNTCLVAYQTTFGAPLLRGDLPSIRQRSCG